MQNVNALDLVNPKPSTWEPLQRIEALRILELVGPTQLSLELVLDLLEEKLPELEGMTGRDLPKEYFLKDLKEPFLEELVAESKEPKGEFPSFAKRLAGLRRHTAPIVLASTAELEYMAKQRPRSSRSHRLR